MSLLLVIEVFIQTFGPGVICFFAELALAFVKAKMMRPLLARAGSLREVCWNRLRPVLLHLYRRRTALIAGKGDVAQTH